MAAEERASVLKAAAEAEEMAAELKEIVLELRADPDDQGKAYARLYDFRTRLGYTLRPLGFGLPRARHDIKPTKPER